MARLAFLRYAIVPKRKSACQRIWNSFRFSRPPGIMDLKPLERGHPRNSSGLAAASSHLSVVDAPQAVRLQRWDSCV